MKETFLLDCVQEIESFHCWPRRVIFYRSVQNDFEKDRNSWTVSVSYSWSIPITGWTNILRKNCLLSIASKICWKFSTALNLQIFGPVFLILVNETKVIFHDIVLFYFQLLCRIFWAIIGIFTSHPTIVLYEETIQVSGFGIYI